LVVAFAAIAILWVVFGAARTSPQDQVAQQGLSYAQQKMVWTSGPMIRIVQEVTAGTLEAALRRSVSSPVRANVNVPDLVRRYGRHHRFVLVILHGTYNSLPPDEGVEVLGDMVELVDEQSRRVVLLTN
jgi:hypothetical protein